MFMTRKKTWAIEVIAIFRGHGHDRQWLSYDVRFLPAELKWRGRFESPVPGCWNEPGDGVQILGRTPFEGGIAMTVRIGSVLLLAGLGLWLSPGSPPASACCPAPPPGGKPVVNADQSVILIWDAKTKTQHFIRRASFQSEAADFGFLVPTPAKPELAESGDKAFAFLQKLTEPEKKKWTPPRGGCGIGCMKSAAPGSGPPLKPAVRVLEE
jgi:hypothetical protein